MSVTALGKPSQALIGNLASKDRSLRPPWELTQMPGRVLGTGFQRAWQREMGPGNSKGNRASAPMVSGLDGWLQRIKGYYIQRRLVQDSSLFWASASSCAKPEHLLVTPWFPPGFESNLELMRVVSLVHLAPGSTGWFLSDPGAQAGCRSSPVHAQMLLPTRTLGILTDSSSSTSSWFVVVFLRNEIIKGCLQWTFSKVLM